MMRDPGMQSNPKARKKNKKGKGGPGKREEEERSREEGRRKFLVLEEERFSLERELRDVESQVKALEEEKLALLDHLVVLEGLVQFPLHSTTSSLKM